MSDETPPPPPGPGDPGDGAHGSGQRRRRRRGRGHGGKEAGAPGAPAADGPREDAAALARGGQAPAPQGDQPKAESQPNRTRREGQERQRGEARASKHQGRDGREHRDGRPKPAQPEGAQETGAPPAGEAQKERPRKEGDGRGSRRRGRGRGEGGRPREEGGPPEGGRGHEARGDGRSGGDRQQAQRGSPRGDGQRQGGRAEGRPRGAEQRQDRAPHAIGQEPSSGHILRRPLITVSDDDSQVGGEDEAGHIGGHDDLHFEPSLEPARDPDGEDVFLGNDDPDPPGTLTAIAGVRFGAANPLHVLDCGDRCYGCGEQVVVDTERGPTAARVSLATRRAAVEDRPRRILRRLSPEDQRAADENKQREEEAFRFCRQRIRERKLPMKLLRAECSLQGSKILFHFASEERIDFRELVKDLAQRLRGRIDMRQVGARDEAKAVGSIGACGRELCCSTFLPAFAPVSIRMAKDQGLVLNPTKIAGQCGRLKCCLTYEEHLYRDLRKGLPKLGKRVHSPGGDGRVAEVDVLRRRIRVSLEGGGSQTFDAEEVTPVLPPGQTAPPPEPETDTEGEDETTDETPPGGA